MTACIFHHSPTVAQNDDFQQRALPGRHVCNSIQGGKGAQRSETERRTLNSALLAVRKPASSLFTHAFITCHLRSRGPMVSYQPTSATSAGRKCGSTGVQGAAFDGDVDSLTDRRSRQPISACALQSTDPVYWRLISPRRLSAAERRSLLLQGCEGLQQSLCLSVQSASAHFRPTARQVFPCWAHS